MLILFSELILFHYQPNINTSIILPDAMLSYFTNYIITDIIGVDGLTY